MGTRTCLGHSSSRASCTPQWHAGFAKAPRLQRLREFPSICVWMNSKTLPLTVLGKSPPRLLLAHRYLKQASPKLSAAILGNVGSIIAFQLGADDAEDIAREIGLKEYEPLTQLSLGEVWIKHATYGGPYHPRLLEPMETLSKGREAALKQNALRNTFSRALVEGSINRFLRPAESRPLRPAMREPDRWPRSLLILRTALTRALKEHGRTIVHAGDRPVVAVDIEIVRQLFTELSIAHGGSADDRNAERDKAFKRATRAAQEGRLLGGIEQDGVQWIYINE
jgi:hypothetical protein